MKFVQAVVRVVVAARPHCFGVIENLTCANGKADKLTKQTKLASIDEDKADEADQGDWGSWTANKHKADEADGRRLTEVCPR